MLRPLEQWICDQCDQIIESPKSGWIEWVNSGDYKAGGFKIVHHASSSPYHPKGDCYHYTHATGRADSHLEEFLGDDGIPNLLRFLDLGPYHDRNYSGPWVRDIREFVELMRRLTIPYYEEARLYWREALGDGFFDGANEIWIYLPDTLKEIVDTYGNKT